VSRPRPALQAAQRGRSGSEAAAERDYGPEPRNPGPRLTEASATGWHDPSELGASYPRVVRTRRMWNPSSVDQPLGDQPRGDGRRRAFVRGASVSAAGPLAVGLDDREPY
jgi:hypothetical protein